MARKRKIVSNDPASILLRRDRSGFALYAGTSPTPFSEPGEQNDTGPASILLRREQKKKGKAYRELRKTKHLAARPEWR